MNIITYLQSINLLEWFGNLVWLGVIIFVCKLAKRYAAPLIAINEEKLKQLKGKKE